jgi:hypothetical protein
LGKDGVALEHAGAHGGESRNIAKGPPTVHGK